MAVPVPRFDSSRWACRLRRLLLPGFGEQAFRGWMMRGHCHWPRGGLICSDGVDLGRLLFCLILRFILGLQAHQPW
jgi:hypothetical protein